MDSLLCHTAFTHPIVAKAQGIDADAGGEIYVGLAVHSRAEQAAPLP